MDWLVFPYVWLSDWLVFDCAEIFLRNSTDGDPPHGVRPAGFFRLQNPGLTVDLVQDIPELSQGLQNQQELAVKLVQSSLTKQIRTSIAVTHNTKERRGAPAAAKLQL